MRWFLPKNSEFQELLERASSNIVAGVAWFREMLQDATNREARVERLKEFEHEGDRLTHRTIDKLNTSFITPFDREDIHALVSRLDDILDLVYAASQRLVIYEIAEVPERFFALADLLVKATEQLQRAVMMLHDRRHYREVLAICVEINRIENEADVIHRHALGELFRGATDAIALLKLKELYTFLEDATDRCEDVANVVESVIIKGS